MCRICCGTGEGQGGAVGGLIVVHTVIPLQPLSPHPLTSQHTVHRDDPTANLSSAPLPTSPRHATSRYDPPTTRLFPPAACPWSPAS